MSTQVKLTLCRSYEVDRIMSAIKGQKTASLRSGGARSVVLPLDVNPFGIQELVIEVDLTTEAYQISMHQRGK